MIVNFIFLNSDHEETEIISEEKASVTLDEFNNLCGYLKSGGEIRLFDIGYTLRDKEKCGFYEFFPEKDESEFVFSIELVRI